MKTTMQTILRRTTPLVFSALAVACGTSESTDVTRSPTAVTGGDPAIERQGDQQDVSSSETQTVLDGEFSTLEGSRSSTTRSSDAKPDRKPGCIGTDQFVCKVELAIVRLTNEKRRNYKLVYSPRLSHTSRVWSKAQASYGRRGRMSHDGWPRARQSSFQKHFGVWPTLSAENVIYSDFNNPTPEAIARKFVTVWWNSKGHRRNMIGNHRSIGAGVARRGNRWYGTQIFSTQIYATKKAAMSLRTQRNR